MNPICDDPKHFFADLMFRSHIVLCPQLMCRTIDFVGKWLDSVCDMQGCRP